MQKIFIKGIFVTSVCFPLFKLSGFYFPQYVETNGSPFSPERETYCMLSIGEAFVFLRFSTFSSLARFPLLQHRGINYPPSAQQMVHPFFQERSFVSQTFFLSAFAFLAFTRE